METVKFVCEFFFTDFWHWLGLTITLGIFRFGTVIIDGIHHYEKKNDDDIEYVRTDAFIEKACSWLKEKCKDYIIVDIDNKFEGVDGLFLEDFKNAMKGE